MPLNKAKLVDINNEAEDIEFMFNPSEISFSRSMSIEQSKGSRTSSGQNKSSFKHPNPYSLKISNIIIDTYEDSTSVLEHVKKFTKAVEFTQKGEGKEKRPPIYLFTWGDNKYLRCFVKDFDFKLTLFLPDGTPVRAVINLSLEQIDMSTPLKSQGASNPSQSTRAASGSTFLT
ncbi:hypothetical protein [cf. Phormidesmis sp. LEGE 11477]|uniref:CIS tube protein n=1 Tax=cf. Phormidesmis sp. LEGE 11477 TaxID=1828680 RepID=UPI0018825922|nr:hypothetical protein [cf. Phormidesmis sp. LEGE 11477]MBE9062424.1 hypothetical protein [cf. Phormidesmis sp. LEGE 11477]